MAEEKSKRWSWWQIAIFLLLLWVLHDLSDIAEKLRDLNYKMSDALNFEHKVTVENRDPIRVRVDSN
jgi:hypothetical protein